MILQISPGIHATGEPVELGSFLAAYMAHLNLFMSISKEQAAKHEIAEKIARAFKDVKITPIQKEGEKDGSDKKNDP